MSESSYQISDSSAATSLLEKILSRKCKIHKSIPCEYIHVKPSEYSPRICCQCMEERNIPPNEYVSIRLLLQASSHTTFNAYPQLNDNTISKKLQQFKGTSDKVQDDLSTFFDNLKSTISIAIEKQKVAQNKLAYLSTSYQGVYDSLAQISQIEKFQQLVKDNNDNDGLLKRFIDDQYSQTNNYTQTINKRLLESQKIYERFSLIDPKAKLEQILKLIESFIFFPTIPQSQENIPQKQPINQQQSPQSSSESQQKQQQQQQEQQLLQKQQQEQNYTSSLVVYQEYVSLVQQGIDKNILEYYQWRREELWSWSSESERLEMSEQQLLEMRSRVYAKTYKAWQEFSEEERLQQLNILRKRIRISQ